MKAMLGEDLADSSAIPWLNVANPFLFKFFNLMCGLTMLKLVVKESICFSQSMPETTATLASTID
jgi:hypothetical protein